VPCSSLDKPIEERGPKISSWQRPAFASAAPHLPAPAAIGLERPPPQTHSPSRPTRSALGVSQASLSVTREAPGWFHPGRSGALKLGPKKLFGVFGEFHPDLLAKLRIDAPIAGFELYLDEVPASRQDGKALEASDLQPVRRDFAFLVDDEIAAGEVVRAASGADRALIAEVGVFDVFTGQGVPTGKKSLAIEVTLQPREKTLTDAEIEAVAERIVAAVKKATGGALRG
jgi:phenylalanyl-tRNA synthetase beta chain